MRDDGYVRRTAGFSLLEVLVVLVLIGITAMIVTSASTAARLRTELRSTAREVAAFLEEAREVAGQRGETVAVRWNAQARTFELGIADAAGFSVLRRLTLRRGMVVAAIDWPSVSGYPTVSCDPLGRAVEGGAMATQPRSLELTAEAMQAGSVTPAQVYRITVFPVWRARPLRLGT